MLDFLNLKSQIPYLTRLTRFGYSSLLSNSPQVHLSPVVALTCKLWSLFWLQTLHGHHNNKLDAELSFLSYSFCWIRLSRWSILSFGIKFSLNSSSRSSKLDFFFLRHPLLSFKFLKRESFKTFSRLHSKTIGGLGGAGGSKCILVFRGNLVLNFFIMVEIWWIFSHDSLGKFTDISLFTKVKLFTTNLHYLLRYLGSLQIFWTFWAISFTFLCYF